MNKVFSFISTTLTVLVTPTLKVVSFLGRSISHLSFTLLNVGKKITSLAKNCFSTSPNHSNISTNPQEEKSLLDKFNVTLHLDPLPENQINSVIRIYEKEITSEENDLNIFTSEEVKNEEDEKVEEDIRNINFNTENIDVGLHLNDSSQRKEESEEKIKEIEIKDKKIPLEKKLDPNEQYAEMLQILRSENRTEDLLKKSSALYNEWLRKNPSVHYEILDGLRVFNKELHREITLQKFLDLQSEYNKNNFYWINSFLQTSLSLKTLEKSFNYFNYYKIRQLSLSKLFSHYENKNPIPCLRIKQSVFYKQMVDHIALKKHQQEGKSEFFFELTIETSNNNINKVRSDVVNDHEIEVIYAQNHQNLTEREIELKESFTSFCQDFTEEMDDFTNSPNTSPSLISSKEAYFKELENETLTFAKPYLEIFARNDSAFEQKEYALEKLANLSLWLKQRKKIISKIAQNKKPIAKLQIGQEYFENIQLDTISFLENQGKIFLIFSINKKDYTFPAHSRQQLSMHKSIRITNRMRVDPSKIS